MKHSDFMIKLIGQTDHIRPSETSEDAVCVCIPSEVTMEVTNFRAKSENVTVTCLNNRIYIKPFGLISFFNGEWR